MIPIINDAWRQSFAKINKNKDAISDQGWTPLNYALSLNDELRATMMTKDSTPKYAVSTNIFPPNKISSKDPSSNIDSNTKMI